LRALTWGMLAGAQTTSASIGLATDAINNSGIENAKEMLNHIPVAYAICYLWGTIGTGIILSLIGPRLIGADLVEACKQYEAEMSEGRPETGMSSAWHKLEIRAFEIAADSKATGKSVAEVEAIHPETRMFIERIRRDGKIIDFDPGTTLAAGDAVAVSAPTEVLVAFEENNKEIADKELLDIPVESVHPTFGRLPTPTMWFMNSVGLNVFIAIVGISAGPVFIVGLKSAGVGLLIGGVVATSVPMLLAPLIGRFIFKFHPAINLGACGGARTSTASAAMVADAAKSEVPMLGYAVPYAINASLMAMLGMLIVLLY
jgi:AspT/YidE/YbjL antiporter-like protein